MKVLITGIAGFLGARLARRLLDEGWEVQGIDVLPRPGAWRLEGLELEYIWGSCQDTHMIDAPYVVHAAAVADFPFALRNPIHTLQQNVLGTATLMEAVARHDGFERIIIISSEAVYGRNPRVPLKETEPANPTNIYGASKVAEEAVATAYGHSHNLPVTVVRSSSLFGEDGRLDQVVPIFARQALRDQDITVHGKGTQSRDFNYVENLVDGILLAMSTPGAAGDIFNISSGTEMTIVEWARLCIEITGSRSQIRYGPQRAGEEALRLPLDITKAKTLLGYSPRVNLSEGLERVVTWLRQLERV